jgi:hypothetical protein
MGLSNDEVISGAIWNGFDYNLQVWVKDGVIMGCGHPETMKDCCNGRKYADQMIVDVNGRENRMEGDLK